MVSYEEGAELARMYGFKFFETSIFHSEKLEKTVHIKNIFTELVRDLISFKRYGDDAKDSFTLKNGNLSETRIKDNQGKGCSC